MARIHIYKLPPYSPSDQAKKENMLIDDGKAYGECGPDSTLNRRGARP
jgi:hypothetical protein